MGAFTADLSRNDAPDLDSETDVGIGFGGGYTWEFNDNWGIGGNVRINGVFVDDDMDDTLWYVTPSGLVAFSF